MPDACAVAEMLQGDVDYALQAQNGPDGKPYGYHYSGFGQTEWKIRRDLTITAGLRYELNTPFQDATNQLGNFNYKVPGGQLVVNPNENINPLWKEAVGNTPFVSRQLGRPGSRAALHLLVQHPTALGFRLGAVIQNRGARFRRNILGAGPGRSALFVAGYRYQLLRDLSADRIHSHPEFQQRLSAERPAFPRSPAIGAPTNGI